jgi:MHS family proline/betaine transporter-like MFS transporter
MARRANAPITVAMTGRQQMSRGSMAIAAFSTIVEWYDFTAYLYFATVLSRVFYGGGAMGMVTTLGGFAIAYLLRPLGAIFFGQFGDRLGRRRMMLLSVAVMTLTMLGTALLPTHAQIGAAAGGLLFALRCVMGFSVGGEYNGVVAYLLEGAPANRRGLVASLASAASEIGALLAAGASFLTVRNLSPAALDAWGWRIPFLVGTALAASVWIARSLMEESPDFRRQQESGTVPREPLRHALTHHRKGIARAFAISALGSITYYVGITYVPAFLGTSGALSESRALQLSTLAAVAVILVTPLIGALTDRIGRKPVLLFLAVANAVLPALMFHLMAVGDYGHALAGALVLACVAGAVSAVGAVATAEQFPGEGRLSGLALGATMATAIFGGATPYVAQLLMRVSGSPLAPGIMIAVVAVCVFPVLLTAPETAPARRR